MIPWIRRHPLIFGALVSLAVLLLVGLWITWDVHRAPRIAVEAFAPDDPAAQITVNDFALNVEALARSRGKRDAVALVRDSMDAFNAWPMDEDDTPSASAAKVRGGIEAATSVLGERAMVFAGEWKSSDGMIVSGIVAITRADTLLKWRAGSVASFVLGDESVASERHDGVTIYYQLEEGESAARISLMNLEGWLALVIEVNAGELAREIASRAVVAEAAGVASKNQKKDSSEESESQASFVQARVHPEVLPRLEAAFEATESSERPEKKEKKKKKEKSAAQRFAEAMEGVESVEFEIAGADEMARVTKSKTYSFELSVLARGPRIREERELFARPSALAVRAMDDPTTSAAALSPAMMQMDFATSFARGGADMLGLDWDEVMEDARDFDWVRPELLDAFDVLLRGHASDVDTANARIGFAFYPTLAETIPVAGVWEDHITIRRFESSPADAWRMLAPQHPSAGDAATSDTFALLGITHYRSPLKAEMQESKRNFVDEFWRANEAPPLAFIAVNFDELVESMYAFPAIVLKGDDRDKWLEWRETSEGLRNSIGSFALRVDRDQQENDSLRITFRAIQIEGISRE